MNESTSSTIEYILLASDSFNPYSSTLSTLSTLSTPSTQYTSFTISSLTGSTVSISLASPNVENTVTESKYKLQRY